MNISEPISHSIFPLAIYENRVQCHEEAKKTILDNYESEKFPVTNQTDLHLPDGTIIPNGLTVENFTGEGHGLATFHKKPQYQTFFKELRQHALAYLKMLGLRTEVVDVYVMKSWLVIHDNLMDDMPFHVHPESNISFVYYTQTSDYSQSIVFENSSKQNEISQDIFNFDFSDVVRGDKMVEDLNLFNEEEHVIPVKEGMILMFPGWRTRHGTRSVIPTHTRIDIQGPVPIRLAVAGDLKVVLKPEKLSTMTLSSSIDHWTKL